jgi:hypothetical protein
MLHEFNIVSNIHLITLLPPNVIRVIKSKGIKRVGHVARMYRERKAS